MFNFIFKKKSLEIKEHIQTLKEDLQQKKAFLIDVRELDEWNAGHIASSIFCPLSELKRGNLPKNIPALDAKVYTYCRRGRRAVEAKALLNAFGFKQVVALKEGFQELAALGFKSNQI